MSSHNAPAVSYPLGRSRFLAVLLSVPWLLGAAATLQWALSAGDGDPGPWAGLGALVLAGLALRRGWQRLPQAMLAWDGQAWAWHGVAHPAGTALAGVEPVLDLQSLVLIRLRGQAGVPSLVWADAASAPNQWLALRRAVHARPHNAGSGSAVPGSDAQP